MGRAGSAESRNNRLEMKNNVISTGQRSSLVTQQENRGTACPNRNRREGREGEDVGM